MAAFTILDLIERTTDPLTRGMLITLASKSVILSRLPVKSIPGSADTYRRQTKLPALATRAIGANFTATKGKIDRLAEPLAVLGGAITIDNAELKMKGTSIAAEMQTHAESMALHFDKLFISGDAATNPTDFDGIYNRLSTGQVVAQGNTAGGDTLTLAKLDEMIDAVLGKPTLLVCNKTMRRKINTLSRAAGQAYEIVTDGFGRQITTYQGIPIVEPEYDETDTAILPFTEPAPNNAAAACTSIIALRTDDVNGLAMIQHESGLDILPPTLSGSQWTGAMEWLVSIKLANPRYAARLRGIKNA
jgi:hypothetical protein